MISSCARAALALSLAACASGGLLQTGTAPPGKSQSAGLRYVFVEGAYDCRDLSRDGRMAESIEGERRSIEKAMGIAVDQAKWIGRIRDLKQILGEPDLRPLVLFYAGHAVNQLTTPARTELCLGDGRIAVDDLLSWTYRKTAYLFLLLDACQSADVDVRRSPVPAAILSASPDLVETTRQGETALGALLAPALACADADKDGWIDDRELLDSLLDRIGQPVLGSSPVPRLRRQANQALAIAAARPGSACRDSAARVRPADPPPHEDLEIRERWSSQRKPPVQADVTILWVPGPVEDPIVMPQGQQYSSAQLAPVWCTSQPFGQCFEVLPVPVPEGEKP